jgi:hypothetical protein
MSRTQKRGISSFVHELNNLSAELRDRFVQSVRQGRFYVDDNLNSISQRVELADRLGLSRTILARSKREPFDSEPTRCRFLPHRPSPVSAIVAPAGEPVESSDVFCPAARGA